MCVEVKEPASTMSYFIKYLRWFGEVGRHFVLHKDIFSAKTVKQKPYYILVWLVFLVLPLLFIILLGLGAVWFYLYGQIYLLNIIWQIVLLGFALIFSVSIISILYYKKYFALLYLPLWIILAPTITIILVYSFFRAFLIKEYSGYLPEMH